MAFKTLKTIVFQKKNFHFPPFIVCLLPSLVNYRPNKTILLSREGAKGPGVTKSTLLAPIRVFHKVN